MDPSNLFQLTHRPFDALAPSSGSEDGGYDDPMVSAIEKNLYRDNSRVTPQEVEAEMQSRRISPRKDPTFPTKLHNLLTDPDAETAITWLPHGRAWKITSQERFETTVLPRYFDHGNLASFMRQVNGWDFKRIAKGADENGYYHELFLRGMPHLCLKMTRTKKSKNGGGILCSPKLLSITPDFYRINRDHPLPGGEAPDAPVSSMQDGSGSDNASDATEGTTDDDVAPLTEQSTNSVLPMLPNEQRPPPERRTVPYSNLATEALQQYILQDFVEAQRTMSNLQVFQQRLRARHELVNSLRTIMEQQQQQQAQQAAASVVPISTTFGGPRGLGGGPNDIACDIALLLEITRQGGNHQRR